MPRRPRVPAAARTFSRSAFARAASLLGDGGPGAGQSLIQHRAAPRFAGKTALQVSNQLVQHGVMIAGNGGSAATCWASAWRSSWMDASRVTTASRNAACCRSSRARSSAFSSSNWQSRRMSARLAAPTRCESMCTSPNASRMTLRVAAGWVSVAQYAPGISPRRTASRQSERTASSVLALANWLIARRWRSSSALFSSLAALSCRPARLDRGTVQLMVRVVRRRKPELLQDLTQFAVERHVPMIEQCRFVLNSQIFVRRAGPAAGGASPRITSAGGNETKCRSTSAAIPGRRRTWSQRVILLCSRSVALYARAAYRPACVTNFVFEIVLDRLQPAFGAVARILHAAERHFGQAPGRGG